MRKLRKGSSVQLKGLHKVIRKTRDGVTLHVYAWRGRGAPTLGTYSAATADAAHRLAYNDSGKLGQAYSDLVRPASSKMIEGLIASYRASSEYQRLAASTKVVWGSWLNRIAIVWGDKPVKLFAAHGARRSLKVWRDSVLEGSGARAADYGMQVMRRLLSYAVDQEELHRNPAIGIASVYRAERSELIWTADEIQAVCDTAPEHVRWAISISALTGLRCGDLARLPWSAVEPSAIRLKTSKTGREAFIPLTAELRAALAAIPRKSPVILTASHGRPWRSGNTMSKAIQHWAKKAKVDRHTHDLRGTAATRYMIAGLTDEEIATVMGWDVKHVARLRGIYVSREAVARKIAEKLG